MKRRVAASSAVAGGLGGSHYQVAVDVAYVGGVGGVVVVAAAAAVAAAAGGGGVAVAVAVAEDHHRTSFLTESGVKSEGDKEL
jgi:hypothetical protein